jgi:hypothetical protein
MNAFAESKGTIPSYHEMDTGMQSFKRMIGGGLKTK